MRTFRLGALAVLTMLSTLAAAPAASDATAYEDVLVYVPSAGSSGATLRNGTKTTTLVYSAGQAIPGHFKTGSDGQVLLYNPGEGADHLMTLSLSGAGTSVSYKALKVLGNFQPLVGDFDGNGVDDIFWYAPGVWNDFIWFFNGDGTYSTFNLNVGGTYRPIVMYANNDDREDIIWYGPGSTKDSIWFFGSTPGTKTVKPVTIGGDYQPVVGHFGWTGEAQPTERVIFYSPSGTDYVWSFDGLGDHISATLPSIPSGYRLLPGQFIEESDGDLLLYGPGSLAEKMWHFGPGPLGDISSQPGPNISGTYATQLGDFDSNGFTDVAFANGPTTTIWKFAFDGTHTQSVHTGLPTGLVRVVRAA